MPPYNFPIEQLTPTATLKISSGKEETPAQKPPAPEAKKPNPMDSLARIAHWPQEMLRIVRNNPNIRMLLLEAVERDDKQRNGS